MSENILKQLKEMAQISAITGRISSIQERNLKMYPLIFFDGVEEVKIDYDLSPIEAGDNGIDLVFKNSPHVSFNVKTDGREILDLDRRCSAIDRAVETLLWAGIVVEVVVDGVSKYRSHSGH